MEVIERCNSRFLAVVRDEVKNIEKLVRDKCGNTSNDIDIELLH
jgi:hypothetical protein